MLRMIVVIPCFDEPEPCRALQALEACDSPSEPVEVVFVVNYGEQVDESTKQRCLQNYEEARDFARRFSRRNFIISPRLAPDMPRKHAGVGLARKTGMDEAARRLPSEGVILCFDADAVCDTNYFTSVENHFKLYPRTEAGSIYFEHPTEGEEYPPEIYRGIVLYELHLRYYNQAQRAARLPFAYHTVGSSMFCTAGAYLKAGGMNRRKAGEDFYFLQKLIPHVRFAELNTSRVIPSPRVSDRVPFGTGRAMMKYVNGEDMLSYSLDSFEPLSMLVKSVPELYRSDKRRQSEILRRFPEYFASYLESIDYYSAIDELNGNCAGLPSFGNRFFVWFNAFRTLKYLNAVHENVFSKSPVEAEALKLLKLLQKDGEHQTNSRELLEKYRKIDREN